MVVGEVFAKVCASLGAEANKAAMASKSSCKLLYLAGWMTCLLLFNTVWLSVHILCAETAPKNRREKSKAAIPFFIIQVIGSRLKQKRASAVYACPEILIT